MEAKNLLSLCDYSGSWSDPYLQNGWNVTRVDMGYPAGVTRLSENLTVIGVDILQWWPPLGMAAHAILAAPPCTCFSRAGSRWWPRMDSSGETEMAIQVFLRCYAICLTARNWWALENPPGRFGRLIPGLPAPSWQFQPYEYGDPWTKQTYIWGTANKPEPRNQVEKPETRRTPNGRTQGRISMMSSSWKREREKTPPGFAMAFYEANPS